MSVVRILTGLDNQAVLMYSVSIMKKEILHFTLDRKKARAIELYAHGTPFKPKTVKLKTVYKRKSKHQKRDSQANID
jgi:hypothetical protein